MKAIRIISRGIIMSIKEAVNSKTYKQFKENIHSGINDKEIARKASIILNQALKDMQALDRNYKPIRVNYLNMKNIWKV